jgi:hypothetical protein
MRIIAPQKPLPKGLSGIYVLQDVKGHKIKPLAISVAAEIDSRYQECTDGFGDPTRLLPHRKEPRRKTVPIRR